jgi:uncharacterized protein YbgA (DUF1722 family)
MAVHQSARRQLDRRVSDQRTGAQIMTTATITTFRDFMTTELADYLDDIANHGADAGYPHISYTSDCVELHDRYQEELWQMLRDDADDFGYTNVAAFLASFKRNDMTDDLDRMKNLIVWYAAERIASEIANN